MYFTIGDLSIRWWVTCHSKLCRLPRETDQDIYPVTLPPPPPPPRPLHRSVTWHKLTSITMPDDTQHRTDLQLQAVPYLEYTPQGNPYQGFHENIPIDSLTYHMPLVSKFLFWVCGFIFQCSSTRPPPLQHLYSPFHKCWAGLAWQWAPFCFTRVGQSFGERWSLPVARWPPPAGHRWNGWVNGSHTFMNGQSWKCPL